MTRNADIEVEEDEGGDLLMALESELTQRRFGSVVRLEVHPDMPDEVLDLLMREMGATEDDVYRIEGPLDLAGLMGLVDLERPELKFEVFAGVTPARAGFRSRRARRHVPRRQTGGPAGPSPV